VDVESSAALATACSQKNAGLRTHTPVGLGAASIWITAAVGAGLLVLAAVTAVMTSSRPSRSTAGSVSARTARNATARRTPVPWWSG
jgi:hypothetical protein